VFLLLPFSYLESVHGLGWLVLGPTRWAAVVLDCGPLRQVSLFLFYSVFFFCFKICIRILI
jgi:hypothetical protein